MPLSDTQIRNAKTGLTPQGKQTDKSYKMSDSRALYLEGAPSGGEPGDLAGPHRRLDGE